MQSALLNAVSRGQNQGSASANNQGNSAQNQLRPNGKGIFLLCDYSDYSPRMFSFKTLIMSAAKSLPKIDYILNRMLFISL